MGQFAVAVLVVTDPYVTDWRGENHFAEWPAALYGVVLFMCGVAYYILAHNLIAHHCRCAMLAAAFGNDYVGMSHTLPHGPCLRHAQFRQ